MPQPNIGNITIRGSGKAGLSQSVLRLMRTEEVHTKKHGSNGWAV